MGLLDFATRRREASIAIVPPVEPSAARRAELDPTGLASRDHAERIAALANSKRSADRSRDELLKSARQLTDQAREEHASDTAVAEDRARGTWTALAEELSADVWRELPGILEKFGDAPRSATVALVEAWQRFDARAVRELGEGLDAVLLVRVFFALSGRGPAAALEASSLPSTQPLARALGEGAVAQAQSLLLELEAAVSSAPLVFEHALCFSIDVTTRRAICSSSPPADHSVPRDPAPVTVFNISGSR